MIELTIINKNKAYFPLIEGDITLTSHINGSCGTLSFNILKDDVISFVEGDLVTLVVDGVKMFKGYVFIKKHSGKNQIQVTCFDQLRYLLNSDTYIYQKKTTTEFITRVLKEYSLKFGTLANTGYVIENRVESDRKILDMINTSLTITSDMTNNKFVLYDDFGLLNLKNINDLKTNYLLTEDTFKNYYYETSINEKTFTQVKVIDDINYKTRVSYVEKNNALIKKYGVLQQLFYIKEDLNPKEYAKQRLAELSEKSTTLNIYGAFGKLNLRAGNSILVDMNLGENSYSDRFLITYLQHKFNDDYHEMDMTIIKDYCLKKD